jgi:tRNA(fMet)-specific endonuclease VapC
MAIAAINRPGGAGSVASWVASFSETVLPTPVVGELFFGALNSGRPRENTTTIETLCKGCRIVPVDLGTAQTYARVRAYLKKAGTPIPENDVWIAAICVQHSFPLATFDTHFAKVEGLAVVAP